jgi:hypothetical protein
VAGLRAPAEDAPRARADQFINGMRVPPSLAPDRLRPPPPLRDRRSPLRAPLRVAVASIIAAPIAYYVSVGHFPPLSDTAGPAALATRMVTSTEFPIPKEELRPGETDEYNSMMAARNRVIPADAAPVEDAPAPRADMLPRTAAVQAAAIPTAAIPAAAAVAVPAAAAPMPAPAEQPAAVEPTRALDPATIKHLMEQQFVAAGDLASARQVFRRAAEAGDAAAALAMGATYDPTVLSGMGVRGFGADIAQARSWYEKAKGFGSPDAPRRLEVLANR